MSYIDVKMDTIAIYQDLKILKFSIKNLGGDIKKANLNDENIKDINEDINKMRNVINRMKEHIDNINI